jgi:RNA polymerase sigma-70 factor (ECF subfamily)
MSRNETFWPIGNILKLFSPSNVNVTELDSDQNRMLKVKSGDQVAFNELYEAHKGAAMSFVYQMLRNSNLTEEITQEVFLRIYRDREQYVPTASFRTYLFTIARNLCLDHLRSAKSKEVLLDADQLAQLESVDEAPTFERAEKEQIEDCLKQLKVEEKECLLHRTVSELSYEEICEVTGLSLAAVKTHIFRGKKNLANCVQKNLK